jgi:hypothetical protein
VLGSQHVRTNHLKSTNHLFDNSQVEGKAETNINWQKQVMALKMAGLLSF